VQEPSSPTLLLETIKCEDGTIANLTYHQQRCDKSRKELYSTTNSLDLKSLIIPPKNGLYRCRIIYAKNIQSIEYIPYQEKEIQCIKIVSSSLDYHLKYANREKLSMLLSRHDNIDDILIEKDGYLTDTSIANIAFYDGTQWFTPTEPLLKGTMRQKLLDEGFLQTRDIKKEDLVHYTQVALTNAMIGFKILKNINIIQSS
jgi:4-amino-4-deoxychorismate lyase